jgi:hypothetical protein
LLYDGGRENLFEWEREEMLSLKAGALVLLLSFVLNGAGSCDGKRSGNAQNLNQSGNAGAPVTRPPEKPETGDMQNDLKQLAQGQHSPVSNAFIAVARDAETYNALRQLVTNLPELKQDFFKSNLVVAAFLGERRTGGYSVRLTRAGNGSIRVEEMRPAGDAITVQVLTYPFSVVAVPVSNQEAPAIEAGRAWQAMTRPYQVKGGEFTMSGGIAGRSEKFGITGRIGVMREGNLATLLFNLQSKGGAKPRTLSEAASGLVQSDGRLAVALLDAGSFVDPPADVLRAKGLLAENENKLSLTFESIPGQVRDGFNGNGTLNAEASAPAPQRRRAATGDVPQ